MTYLNNRTRGQWKAHGRYLARESATGGEYGPAGFNHWRDSVDVVRELNRWQLAGDQRVWKIILSPEFGDRVDLRRPGVAGDFLQFSHLRRRAAAPAVG